MEKYASPDGLLRSSQTLLDGTPFATTLATQSINADFAAGLI
jgi:hypothetical protein